MHHFLLRKCEVEEAGVEVVSQNTVSQAIFPAQDHGKQRLYIKNNKERKVLEMGHLGLTVSTITSCETEQVIYVTMS